VLASSDARLSSAISAFRLKGKPGRKTCGAGNTLALQHGIFTVPRNGLVSGSCIRVTPGIFTPESHIDALLKAMQKVTAA
jgi:selenocysteine lyase/cysteine desulfurase